jgi:prepilin-type N-terminal cleavage/methylation domain-containing protein
MHAPDRGFTLVEVLLATAVIAILSAIAIPRMLGARVNANESAVLKDLRAAQTDQTGRPIDCRYIPDSLRETKSGYVRGCSPGVYWAIPETPGRSGVRGFGADAAGRLCFTRDGTVPNMAGDCTLIN